VAGALDSNPPTVTSVAFEQTQPPSADGCVAAANDVTAGAASTTASVCVNVPIIINFSEDMDQSATAAAISFSPSISAGQSWAAPNRLIITPLGNGLSGGTTYALTVSTAARDLAYNALQADFGLTFTTENAAGVRSVGVASQTCDMANTAGNAAGGNWVLGSCWWDSSLSLLGPSYYTLRGANAACGTDTNTDNVRIIFNTAMDPAATLGAINVSRVSPPITTVYITSAAWDATNRMLTLSLSESGAACDPGANADALDLRDSSASGAGFPIYLLEIDISARSAGGVNMSSTFSFAFEGD